MTESPPTDEPLPLNALSRRGPGHRLSLVWSVPVLAVLLAGWIGIQTIRARGPTISVAFTDADGIEAGKTKVRFKNVSVGTVRQVTLGEDLHTVHVVIEMVRFAQPFLVKSTRFWVVRPRLDTTGISGLGTFLTGDYIGMEAGSSKEPAREFVSLNAPPAVASDSAGRQYRLQAHDIGSLGVGAPAYFHRVKVGEVSAVTLAADGHGVVVDVFVNAPYDRFVTADTRFWHASGVDVAVDSRGVHLRTESVAAILVGGIAFEAPADSTATTQASGKASFVLASNRESAMRAPDRLIEPYILYFKESLRGLQPGAVVDFRGVEIGEVISLNVDYDSMLERFRFPVLINIYPERIRARYIAGGGRPDVQAHDLVARMIKQGFRGQLRTASLLTGQLYIALDFFPNATAVAPQPLLTPMPLPTVAGNFADLQQSIVSVAHKLDSLPLEKMGRDLDASLVELSQVLVEARTVLNNADHDVLPQATAALAQARTTLEQAQHAVSPGTLLQSDLHSSLESITRAADSIRILSDYLEQHPEALIRGKVQDAP